MNVCPGPPQRAVCKQFTVFVSKIFKITKVEGNVFSGSGRRNEQKKGYLGDADKQRCFAKKSILKYLVKLTGKLLCWSLSLACIRETFLKKRLLYRCFPIKLLEYLFHRTPVNSLTTFTIIFNFVENILVHEAG